MHLTPKQIDAARALMPSGVCVHGSERDGTRVTVRGRRIIFACIVHDENAPDPLENDGAGRIISFSRRHSNADTIADGVRKLQGDPEDDGAGRDPYAVALSYFEHGACQWSVRGEHPARENALYWRFDGVDTAGVWYPDDAAREDIDTHPEADRYARAVELARQACTVFTDWSNGDVFGYTVDVYEVKHDAGHVLDAVSDYRHATPTYADGCFGYYGFDTVRDECAASIAWALRARKDVAALVGRHVRTDREGAAHA